MGKSRAKKKSQAKKRSQAKKKSQSEEVPVKKETTTKEEVPTNEEIPVNGKNPVKGQSPAKDETPATEDRWTKYPIETDFIAKMKPLSSPVTRDLEHEVLCDFNVDDALPAGKYMPEIACSPGTSLLLIYEVLCPDPSAATTIGEGNSAPKDAWEGKAKSKPDNNTENSVAKYTATVLIHQYGDKDDKSRLLARALAMDWFSRLDYHVCVALHSNPNSTWLRAIKFESADARCEMFESARSEKDYIHNFAGILRWLRDSMLKRSSTNLCSIESVESEEGISLRLWDEDPCGKFICAVYGELWDAPVKSLTKGKITWTEGENIEEAWRRHQAQLEIDEMSEALYRDYSYKPFNAQLYTITFDIYGAAFKTEGMKCKTFYGNLTSADIAHVIRKAQLH
ncbi:unnamed protein product [Fusarium equiseti]|uniref:Uncharacterized protein n=1 Tax=Fusarium equiseti TaxID=61235 RepID=A0A8J2IZZ0_FUSEQ|nr:unnamed protein product [Fusarium equiseti]